MIDLETQLDLRVPPAIEWPDTLPDDFEAPETVNIAKWQIRETVGKYAELLAWLTNAALDALGDHNLLVAGILRDEMDTTVLRIRHLYQILDRI